MQALLRGLDWLIPANLKNHSSEQLIRARVLVAALIMSAVISPIANVPLLLSSDYATEQKMGGLIITAVVVAFYIGAYFLLRFTGSLIFAGNLYCFSAYTATTVAVTITGGYPASPFFQMHLVVPLFSFLICGRRWGYLWTSIVIATYAVFFALSLAEVTVPNLATSPHHKTLVFSMWASVIIALMFCLGVYDNISEDLTRRIKEERDRFRHDAAHDELTALANRRSYERALNRGIGQSRETRTQLALLIVDLNEFKSINDRLGHHAGDFILQVVANRLRNVVRQSDLAARIGGDEFAVILYDIKEPAYTVKIARKIQDSIAKPIEFNGEALSVSASIGYAVYPHQGKDPESLAIHADTAMYTAKRSKFKIQS